MGTHSIEKDECFSCGRWNKPSVKYCKCGVANPDHELYGHVVYKGLEEKEKKEYN